MPPSIAHLINLQYVTITVTLPKLDIIVIAFYVSKQVYGIDAYYQVNSPCSFLTRVFVVSH